MSFNHDGISSDKLLNMIISASRRTDIPAYYSKWFFKRLKAGFLYVRNPMNYRQVSMVQLNPNVVDFIVFWTKDASPMLEQLDQLSPYPYYFLYTITPYDQRYELALPRLEERMATFIQLSQKIGREKVIWRYDPILYDEEGIDFTFHCEQFEMMAKILAPYTEKCIFSFLELFKKSVRNLSKTSAYRPTEAEQRQLIKQLSTIAKKHQITLQCCAQTNYFKDDGVESSRCIDSELIERITGKNFKVAKDKNQRAECGCCESIDIGQYNSCEHQCLYCYANQSLKAVKNNREKHQLDSPFLIGDSEEGDRVGERKMSLLALSDKQDSKGE